MKVTRRIDRALRKLEGLPGVRTWPGATEDELTVAEAALGGRLPEGLRHLLSRTNGLAIQHGLHRILGVGPRAAVDLVAFNERDAWKWAFPAAFLDDVVVYALDASTWVTGFELATGGDVAGDVLNPETIRPRDWDLSRRLDRGWTHMARGARMRLDHGALLARFDRLPDGHGVVHGPTWHQRNRVVAAEATMHPLPEALVRAGDLWRSALELRADHELAEPETWTDEAGRTRWRWTTVAAAASADDEVSSVA